MVKSFHSLILFCLLFLGACASRDKAEMKEYRAAIEAQDYEKAAAILSKSRLVKDQKSKLLWELESGTLALNKSNEDGAIVHFQKALDLIDELYTKKVSAKLAAALVNDASDVFYGSNYERSYAHYFLAKAYYSRYLKLGNKLDLQAARATILAWDTYFTTLQRSASLKTLYTTDLMLKVFGGQIHEVSGIRNDSQIALQLYQDAIKILEGQGGIFSLFNKKSADYIRFYEKEGKPDFKLYEPTPAQEDLKDFLQYKILALTKEIRGADFTAQVKALKVKPEISKKAQSGGANVVIVLEEGLIPEKIGKPFSFGIKGAMNSVGDDGAKRFIATVGVDAITLFAMNKLGMMPSRGAGPGSFIFAQTATKLAVAEAAVEFELPVIENVPLVSRLEVFILDENGAIVNQHPLPVVSENGDLARVVLEEDAVSQYTRTGVRVATKHVLAIISAMGVYQTLNRGKGGDLLAKTAALATYVGATKGIAAMEKADTRHWTSLPQALRMTELKLSPGTYQVAIASYTGTEVPKVPGKILGSIVVNDSGKSIHHLRFQSP